MWRIGEPVKKLKTLDELHGLGRAGVFANDSIAKLIRQQYPVQFTTVYDANVVKQGKKNYKDRRSINFLILGSKSADN
jgi:hypothetical protein